jgi:hypothetical protein
MTDSLEVQFHVQMVNVYRNALTQVNYKATKSLEMVTMNGGSKAAKTLLHKSYLHDGFAEPWQRGRLPASTHTTRSVQSLGSGGPFTSTALLMSPQASRASVRYSRVKVYVL